MSSSAQDPLKTYVASRFLAVQDAFKEKYADAKKQEEAQKKRSLAYFVFESLMESALKRGTLRQTERDTAPACAACKGGTAVLFRNEDRAAMGIYEKIETIHYAACFACCTAHELYGSHTDGKGGRHWGLLRP